MATLSRQSSVFDPFLLSTVGEGRNGVSLTVLSAYARQDVDPWERAAALSRLSAGAAHAEFLAMLAALPGDGSQADRTEIAARVIRLLPHRPTTGPWRAPGAPRPPSGESPSEQRNLLWVLFYLGSMILGLWVFSGSTGTPPESGAAEKSTASTVVQPSTTARREEP